MNLKTLRVIPIHLHRGCSLYAAPLSDKAATKTGTRVPINEENFMKQVPTITAFVVSMLALLMTSAPVWADGDNNRLDELEAKTLSMAAELDALREELRQAKEAGTVVELETLRSDVQTATQSAQRAEKSASEWNDTKSVTHLAGYASADYDSPENGNSAFTANFNPMFHFMYGDRLLWESELAIELDENGETEVVLEYSTIDIFLNDNLMLIAGKFLSPLGNFRQNLHPSWINKLGSAPPGFGHDGAAPAADIGVQLRGGMSIFGKQRLTYAGYIANGPKLIGEDGEIHGIETEGVASDADDSKVVGGRISLLPTPRLEIGVSAAIGDAAVVENEDMEIAGDPKRDYEVFGIDANYRWKNLDLRGEYIMQDIANEETSISPEGGKWESWYLQGAYKFGQDKWESVLRYTDYTSPHADQSQEQWALGLNYLVTPNSMIKFAYEFNDGLAGELTDNDRFLIQLAYGY